MTNLMENNLEIIYLEIADRTGAIKAARPRWPCRRGCDLCCRRLPCPPEVTAVEWDRLYAGFRQLPASTQTAVAQKIRALPDKTVPGQYLTCPFLDEAAAACLVYKHRPVACRSYGFYVSRRSNQWCGQIEEMVNEGLAAGITLGNHQALTRRMTKQFGPVKSITTWFTGERHIS